MTQEITLGTEGNANIGSSGVCTLHGCEYRDTGTHEKDKIYLHGQWHDDATYAEYTGKENEGYLLLIHKGKITITLEGYAEVNVDGAKAAVEKKDNTITLTTQDEQEVKIIPEKGVKISTITLT